MKIVSALVTTLTALLLTACDAPNPDAVPVSVSTEEAAAAVAVAAEIERINQLEDPDELYKILAEKTMFSDVGKAADARLAKVLEDDFAAAKNTYELSKLKEYTRVPRSQLDGMYMKREGELKK